MAEEQGKARAEQLMRRVAARMQTKEVNIHTRNMDTVRATHDHGQDGHRAGHANKMCVHRGSTIVEWSEGRLVTGVRCSGAGMRGLPTWRQRRTRREPTG